MKVFKFGGASVSTVERIERLPEILNWFKGESLLIIISAMGKTTNALEKVAKAFFEGKTEEALNLFDSIKKSHLSTAKHLLVATYRQNLEDLVNIFTEVEWLLHDKPVRNYDYYYDQIVCVGELLSTCIVSAYLNERSFTNQWIDVRDVLRTDDNFRNATVDWRVTESLLGKIEIANQPGIFITQGFIGATDENESTTLGREGSDYTAAIFANLLNAESLTIWKDVAGVMNADPKEYPEAVHLKELSFTEVIEMAFYGAQVIHPKTIKPLQNKNIPLHVKSFINPKDEGTTVSGKAAKNLPPVIVVKKNQVLIHLRSQDFSFVGEQPMSLLYKILGDIKVTPNLIQTGAISVQVCLDDVEEKINQLASATSERFDVSVEKNLSLLTVRHYNDVLLKSMLKDSDVVLTQQTKEMVQAVFR